MNMIIACQVCGGVVEPVVAGVAMVILSYLGIMWRVISGNRKNRKRGKLQCQGFDGPCKSTHATRRRQNTQYANDESNWVVMCDDCYEHNEEYWAVRWSEVYAGLF